MRLQLIVQRGAHGLLPANPPAPCQLLAGQGALLLGRGPESTLTFSDGMVSGRHAVVQAEADGFYLLDLQSTNGAFVNGVRVQRVLLRDGDVLQLGASGPELRVQIDQTAPLAQAAPLRTLGLYQPEADAGKAPHALGAMLAALGGGALAFVVFVLTVSSLGFVAAFVGAVFAFVPVLVYLLMFLWLDRYDPEPFAPLAFAFGWGALFAIFVSGIFNTLFGAAALSVVNAPTADTLTAVISAPIIEEATKGLGVLLIWLLFRKDFDSVVDGIVYAGVVALGFAAVENVDYYGRSFSEEGVAGLLSTFILRGVLSPFSHVLFTSMTGIGCGIARESHNATVKLVAPLGGYVAAMFLHALWNLLASFSNDVFFLGYVLLEVPLFLLFAGTFVYLVRREGRILRTALAFEVQRGLLTQQQLDVIVSLFNRTRWTWGALGNASLLNARRQFLRTAAKLGLCHWHVQRALSAQSQTASFPLIPRLQAELFALRERI